MALLNLVNKLLIHVHIFIIMIFLKNKTVEIQPVSEKTGLYRQKKKELLFEQAYILKYGSNIIRNIGFFYDGFNINRHLFTFFPVAIIQF